MSGEYPDDEPGTGGAGHASQRVGSHRGNGRRLGRSTASRSGAAKSATGKRPATPSSGGTSRFSWTTARFFSPAMTKRSAPAWATTGWKSPLPHRNPAPLTPRRRLTASPCLCGGWATSNLPESVEPTPSGDGGFEFAVGERRFRYDRAGLRRV